MKGPGLSKKPNSNGVISHHVWIMIPQWTYSHLASSNMLMPRAPMSNVVSMSSSPINIMSTSNHICVRLTHYHMVEESLDENQTAPILDQVYAIQLCGNISKVR